jgi:hypothetical protein
MKKTPFYDEGVGIINSQDGGIDQSRILAATAGFTCYLSTVAGTAFISNPSIPLTGYIGAKVTLTTGGKTLVGWIAGSSNRETLSTENITDPGFDNTGSWTQGAGWSVATSIATAAASVTDITMSIALTAGALYKMVMTSNALTGGTYQCIIEGTNIGTAVNTVGAVSSYRNVVSAAANNNGIHGATALSATFTDISLKKVLTPSDQGAVIVSAQGGTTKSWTSNNGIDANAATYTITITSI